MRLIIEHRDRKREVDGPFNLCASRSDFEIIRTRLDEWLEDGGTYGWIHITTSTKPRFEDNLVLRYEQANIVNTTPEDW